MMHKALAPLDARRLILSLGAGMALTRPFGAWAQSPGGEAPLPGIGGDIRLTDQHGQAFELYKQAAQPTLLFFGFTQCAQVCPQALGLMQSLIAQLQPRQPPRLVFVTLDPLSDTPATLKQYLAHFDPRIVGLTGSPAAVADAARRYGVSTSMRDGVLDHSARLYLLSPNHEVSRVYRLNAPIAQLARDILAMRSSLMSFNLL